MNKKTILILSVALFLTIIPLAVGASYFHIKPIYPPRPSHPYLEHAAKGEKLIDDGVKEFLLVYIHEANFKSETVSDENDAEQNKRIKQKNELLQEYRTIVDKMYEEKVMKIEDYKAKYDYLMGLIKQLMELEPERTPQELLVIETRVMLARAKEYLQYSGIYEGFAEHLKIKLPELKQLVVDLEKMKSDYEGGKISYEEGQRKFDEYKKMWNNEEIGRFSKVGCSQFLC